MKILVFCYEFPPIGGGAGNALYHLAREWAVAGHEVVVVTSRFKNLPAEQTVDGIFIVRLEVGRRLISRGTLWQMFRYTIETAIRSGNYYRRFRPDLCVAFMSMPGGFAPFIMKARYKVPYLCQIRGGDVPGFGRTFLGKLHYFSTPFIRMIWDNSDSLIANAQGLADLADRADSRHVVSVIHNGVDTDFFQPASEITQTPAKRTIDLLFVGRFVDAQKNISFLCQAVKEAKEVRLKLVGDGPDLEKIRRLVRRLKIKDRVEFTGWLKGDKLLAAYQAADVYVSASLYEGMSNTVLEAMACGLPLILSDIPGHRELVNSGRNGYLLDPNNPQRWRECLSEFQRDVGKHAEASKASRLLVCQKHSWKTLAKSHLQVYADVLRRNEQPNRRDKSFLKSFLGFESLREAVVVLSALVGFLAVSILTMCGQAFTTDQITYVTIAKRILGLLPGSYRWLPTENYAYLVAWMYGWTKDFVSSFIFVYACCAFLYLWAMYWCMKFFIPDKRSALLVSLISIVPHYTMAMTYWGFAGFEYIKARILLMPLLPILLRLFFQWCGKGPVGIVFILCALGSFLSFESFHLMMVLLVFSVPFLWSQKKGREFFRPRYYLGVVGAIAILACVLFYCNQINPKYPVPREFLSDAYERLVVVDLSYFQSLSRTEFIDHYWKAAYAGFWWALFPPSLIDFLFALFNSFFLIVIAGVGAWLMVRRNRFLLHQCLIFIGCVLITSYGYQIFRFVGWKIWSLPPDTFEEARAIKFIFFPVYLFVGVALLEMGTRKKWLWACVILLLMDPLSVLRGLPQPVRQNIQRQAMKIMKQPQYEPYLASALKLNRPDELADLEKITQILKGIYGSEGRRAFVLSDRHELIESGDNIVMSYHHKRLSNRVIDGTSYETLPYWHRAYQQVQEAIRSMDPRRIRACAEHYGCDFIVVPYRVKDSIWMPLYEGKAYSLYRLPAR